MTNKVAFSLFALIVLAIALDLYMDWGATLFLSRKFMDLMDWLIFWR